ncbi:hypothetical protein C1646_777253 [Rhizophagus diaphanus]|nr:hypothetical protein C1646_777253 [Rhizophagus diaphanus] [Rhizophagus sp. MUCL 43196]
METNDAPLSVKKKRPVEIHNYPKKSIIQYANSKRSYTYNIIKEGTYPPAAYLKFTKGQKEFRIPDNYEVKTSLRKLKTRQIIKCIIKYVEKKLVYWVYYRDKFQYHVKSEKSSSDVTCLYAKALNSETKTRYSILKSFDNLTPTGQNNRAKKIAKSISAIFDQETTKCCHLNDDSNLKSIEFNIRDNSFHFSFNEDNVKIKHKARAAVQAYDKVSAEKKDITYKMNEIIPISLINIIPSLSDNSVNSEIHINDAEIIDNLQQSIGKEGRQDIVNILRYLIPDIINPTIHLRISGDGRNVGRKVKQVMVTCSILNDLDNIYRPENYYTIILYPGIEKYEILNVVLELLIMELRKLKEEGFRDNQNREWKVELYFSSDWKFLAICLGLNAANTIFDMIPLQNWVPDELHIMLRITDG